jgi:long-chain fatty acid transport protein
VNPAFSFKPTDNVAIGFGVNWQKIDAEFTNKVNYSGALLAAAAANGIAPGSPTFNAIAASTPGLDSSAKVEGDDDAWGWNIGILVDVTKNTRIGASYRSEIEYDVNGNASFDNPTPVGPPALQPTLDLLSAGVNSQRLYNGGIKADITLPAIVNVSVFHQLNDRWDLMADAQWTGWSSIKELNFVRTDGTGSLSNTPENFDDAWRIAVGANYRHSDKWMFRGGIAWDQTPVNTTDRTPRLPDEDRWWFSVGTQYKHSKNLKFDAGFTYINSSDASINQNAGSTATYGLINGNYEAYVTIFSFQGTYTF